MPCLTTVQSFPTVERAVVAQRTSLGEGEVTAACMSVEEACVHVFCLPLRRTHAVPPVPAVLLGRVLPSQCVWHLIYFKLKIDLTVTQFWVTRIHGLEFSQRIFMSGLATCIVMTKYLTRRIYFGWWCERMRSVTHGSHGCRNVRQLITLSLPSE